MSATIFKFTCGSCQASFDASGVPEMSYGEFILRTETGEEGYLEAVANPAFDEVAKHVEAHQLVARLSASKQGAVVQKVFGAVCDPSPTGLPYEIGMMPRCPVCLSHKMASWGPRQPPMRCQVPEVTQRRWNALGDVEKTEWLDRATRAALEE